MCRYDVNAYTIWLENNAKREYLKNVRVYGNNIKMKHRQTDLDVEWTEKTQSRI
jgi:hypothetical protein